MSDPRPIGILDSGLGGLVVVNELQRILPSERVVYLGDTARFPYGTRSDDDICTFALQGAGFLGKHDIKMLIVACNTAASLALDQIRAVAPEIPVIGAILPVSRAAGTRTAARKVGVIGTAALIRSGAYTETIHTIDPLITVYAKASPLLVPLVEEGLLDTDITRVAAQYYLYELVDVGIDCLILGCTHYPLLLHVIQETVGTRVHVLDSTHWAAREAKDILVSMDATAVNEPEGREHSEFYLTDLKTSFAEASCRFFGRPLPQMRVIGFDALTE